MVQHIRRTQRKMPSVKKHGLSAGLLLALIALSTYSWLNFIGKRQPATTPSGVEITLSEPPVGDNAKALPDLLSDDNIPLEENPTETLDLIGGPDKVRTAPKTIIIDGRSTAPLIRAPIQGLSRMSPFGRVPHPNADGRSALENYAKPFAPVPDKKYIALVIGGLGLNPELTQRAIDDLPGTVTLSFAAQAPGLQSWVNKARARGHEVMIELPMENAVGSTGNTTIYTLTTAGPDSKNIKNLDYLLSRAQGYFAVTNYGGDGLVTNEDMLATVFAHLKNAGLGFVYDGALPNSLVGSIGKAQGLKTITARTFLDEQNRDRDSVRTAITRLQNQTGQTIPIGMGFSYAGTIDGVIDWMGNKPDNIDIAPVSYALKIQ